jgi:hypothetical protein
VEIRCRHDRHRDQHQKLPLETDFQHAWGSFHFPEMTPVTPVTATAALGKWKSGADIVPTSRDQHKQPVTQKETLERSRTRNDQDISDSKKAKNAVISSFGSNF